MTLHRLLAEAQRRGLIEDDPADDEHWAALVERVVADVPGFALPGPARPPRRGPHLGRRLHEPPGREELHGSQAAVARWDIRRIYADAADPKTIADLRGKWRLPIVAVEKHNKATWIQDMRAKARSGRFQVLRDSSLHDEFKPLVPDPSLLRRKRLEAPPGSEDHCGDASRYLYRGVFTEFPHVASWWRADRR